MAYGMNPYMDWWNQFGGGGGGEWGSTGVWDPNNPGAGMFGPGFGPGQIGPGAQIGLPQPGLPQPIGQTGVWNPNDPNAGAIYGRPTGPPGFPGRGKGRPGWARPGFPGIGPMGGPKITPTGGDRKWDEGFMTPGSPWGGGRPLPEHSLPATRPPGGGIPTIGGGWADIIKKKLGNRWGGTKGRDEWSRGRPSPVPGRPTRPGYGGPPPGQWGTEPPGMVPPPQFEETFTGEQSRPLGRPGYTTKPYEAPPPSPIGPPGSANPSNPYALLGNFQRGVEGNKERTSDILSGSLAGMVRGRPSFGAAAVAPSPAPAPAPAPGPGQGGGGGQGGGQGGGGGGGKPGGGGGTGGGGGKDKPPKGGGKK